MKKHALLLSALAGLAFSDRSYQGFPNYKRKARTGKAFRSDERPKSYVPPRSMTPAEKEYYAIHKNLNHFKEPA